MNKGRLHPRLLPVFFMAASLLAGCISVPRPASLIVDREAPEFKAAVARESASLQAAGKSPAKADELAVRTVTRATITTEKDRRDQLVAPLLKGLKALQQPRTGCWAYTVMTTTRKADTTTVEVERFDPFEPEERLWTLVTRDGRTPTDREQADYRTARLRAWKREANSSKADAMRLKTVESDARYAEFTVVGGEAGSATFSFDLPPMKVAAIGSLSGSHEMYRIDANGQVARHTNTALGPGSMLGGTLQFAIWDAATDYAVLEPTQPPFIVKTFEHYQVKLFAMDSGEIVRERIFSDYHRVKCYDDRFEVQIGEPTMRGFIP